MSEHLHRITPTDLEVRSDGRTVTGIAVPFGAPAEIRTARGAYTETFLRGAFTRTIAERGHRVKFCAEHDRGSPPLGRALLLREDSAGLYGEFKVSATVAGDEVLELIRDGALDALSIGFRAVTDRWNADRTAVDRVEAALYEVSACAFPVYDEARVLAVRSDDAIETAGPGRSITDAQAALARMRRPTRTSADAQASLARMRLPITSADAARRLANLKGA